MYVDQGFTMVSVAADMIALPAYLTDALGKARGTKDATPQITGPYGR